MVLISAGAVKGGFDAAHGVAPSRYPAAIPINPGDAMYAAKIENNAVKVFDKHTGSLKRIL